MGKLEVPMQKRPPIDNFLFFGKLIIIALYTSGMVQVLGSTDLPLLALFEHKMSSDPYFLVWQFLFLVSSIFIFLNRKAKLLLCTNGILLILALLMNELVYSHSVFFAACMLITFSMSSASYNYVPIQLSIVYFGAFIDKLCFETWRNGDFMMAFFEYNANVNYLKTVVDADFLMLSMTYSSLIIECALSIFVLIPKTRTLFLLLGLCFHFSTIILMNSFFGIFITSLGIAYYALVKTPVSLNDQFRFSKLTHHLKFIVAAHKSNTRIWYKFELNQVEYHNYIAVVLSLILNPFTAVLAVLVLTSNFMFLKKLLTLLALVFVFVLVVYTNYKRYTKT